MVAPARPGTEARKASGALRTIGELSAETGIAHHVLRYWETRFPQLRPLTRAGNRRYYRVEDAVLVRRIDTLLNREGYTIRGVQQLLAGQAGQPGSATAGAERADGDDPLRRVRDLLADALAKDAARDTQDPT